MDMKKIHIRSVAEALRRRASAVLITAIVIVAALNACISESGPGSLFSQEELKLIFRVDSQADTEGGATRAEGNGSQSLPAGAQVGVFFLPKGSETLYEGIEGEDIEKLDQVEFGTLKLSESSRNHLYNADGTTSNKVYWNDYITALDIYAYSPHRESLDYTYIQDKDNDEVGLLTDKDGLRWVALQDQSTADKLTASDLLVSNNARDLSYTADKSGIDLTFTHVMAKLRINIVDNSGSNDAYTQAQLQAADATIKDIHRGAYIHFVNTAEKTSGSPNNPSDITPLKASSPDTGAKDAADNSLSIAATFDAIVAPQTILYGDAPLATISLMHKPDGDTGANVTQTYSVKRSVLADNDGTIKLKQGYLHVINVTITKTGIKLSMQLKPWEESSVSTTVQVDGLTDGTLDGNSGIAPATNDALYVWYVEAQEGPSSTTGRYTTYTAGSGADAGWNLKSGSSPIYWDAIEKKTGTSGPYPFVAQYIPTAQPTTGNEKDICTGIASPNYGAPLNFRMTHAMAQLTVKLVPGTGYAANPSNPSNDEKAALADALTTRSIYLRKVNPIGNAAANAKEGTQIQTDGTATVALKDAVESITGADPFSADAITSASGISYLVAPQTLDDDCTIYLKRDDNGNSYTVKLNTLPAPTASGTPSDGSKFTKLEPGKHYTLTLTVSETEVAFSLTLSDWTNLTGSGELTPDDD